MLTFTIAIYNKTNLLPKVRSTELRNATWSRDRYLSRQFLSSDLFIESKSLIIGTIVANPGVERAWALVQLWYREVPPVNDMGVVRVGFGLGIKEANVESYFNAGSSHPKLIATQTDWQVVPAGRHGGAIKIVCTNPWQRGQWMSEQPTPWYARPWYTWW